MNHTYMIGFVFAVQDMDLRQNPYQSGIPGPSAAFGMLTALSLHPNGKRRFYQIQSFSYGFERGSFYPNPCRPKLSPYRKEAYAGSNNAAAAMVELRTAQAHVFVLAEIQSPLSYSDLVASPEFLGNLDKIRFAGGSIPGNVKTYDMSGLVQSGKTKPPPVFFRCQFVVPEDAFLGWVVEQKIYGKLCAAIDAPDTHPTDPLRVLKWLVTTGASRESKAKILTTIAEKAKNGIYNMDEEFVEFLLSTEDESFQKLTRSYFAVANGYVSLEPQMTLRSGSRGCPHAYAEPMLTLARWATGAELFQKTKSQGGQNHTDSTCFWRYRVHRSDFHQPHIFQFSSCSQTAI